MSHKDGSSWVGVRNWRLLREVTMLCSLWSTSSGISKWLHVSQKRLSQQLSLRSFLSLKKQTGHTTRMCYNVNMQKRIIAAELCKTRNFLPWEWGMMQLITCGLLFLMFHHQLLWRFSSISPLEKWTFLTTATCRACIVVPWKWLFRNISFKQQCWTCNTMTTSSTIKYHTLLTNCRLTPHIIEQCNIQSREE